MFAGNVTLARAEPDPHGTVNGNPARVGDDANLHVAASPTVADKSTPPPAGDNDDTDAENDETEGAGVGATVTTTGTACTDPPPGRATVSLNVYFFGTRLVFVGNVTLVCAEPDAHGTVNGNPATAGDDVNLHVAASPTVADRSTPPPAGDNDDTDAVNDDTVGGSATALPTRNVDETINATKIADAQRPTTLGPPTKTTRFL